MSASGSTPSSTASSYDRKDSCRCRRWLAASGAALGTQITKDGWKEDRGVDLAMNRVHHWRIWSHPMQDSFKRCERLLRDKIDFIEE